MFDRAAVLAVACAFDPYDDGLAAKSRELIVNLLHHSDAPFSRNQFNPGHITCTALVLSPDGERVLLMHHHRLQRWLLPGGHVEEGDPSLEQTARREAIEETNIELPDAAQGTLVGMDVHGIPPKRDEPYHLHHDLIFAFTARSNEFAISGEAPEIVWAALDDFPRYEVPPSIARAVERAMDR